MKPLLSLITALLLAACSLARVEQPLPAASFNQPRQVAALPTAFVSPTTPALATELTPIPSAPPTQEVYVSALTDYGPAPELANEAWLNVESPLRLSDLRGQVVLIDMWTFG